MINLIGQRVGQYEITARLGDGGMATVFRARQINVKRDVAVKVILPNLAQKEAFSRRFDQEAQTVAQLSHPNIVKLFDYGVLRGFHMRLIDAQFDPRTDIYFFVMELLNGGSLSSRLRKGPLPVETIRTVLPQLASALDYAHTRQVVHRDLKPANILFDDLGNAYLTDFGIAKLLHDSTTLTQEGTTLGTPSYMAPEQWDGQNLGGWTDVYALGVLLYEMLTGKLPFVASTPFRIMHMHIYDAPPSVYKLRDDLPRGLDAIIGRAMAKAPDSRYPSAQAMAEDFLAATIVSNVPDPAPVPTEAASATTAGAPPGTVRLAGIHAEGVPSTSVSPLPNTTAPAVNEPVHNADGRRSSPYLLLALALAAILVVALIVLLSVR